MSQRVHWLGAALLTLRVGVAFAQTPAADEAATAGSPPSAPAQQPTAEQPPAAPSAPADAPPADAQPADAPPPATQPADASNPSTQAAAPAARATQRTDSATQRTDSATTSGSKPAGAGDTGPVIELPPAEPAAERDETPTDSGPSIGVAPQRDTLVRGLGPARMAATHTVIGGYGQFGLNALRAGTHGPYSAAASVRRLVLFVAHPLTDDIRVYSEFEWENALACRSCEGSAEVEQAFIQWRLLGDALSLRAGLVLVPMGIINQWHEPPVFNGVERPDFDNFIIPTTWRELGVGITGTLAQLLRYELYFTTTLNPLRLNEAGLSAARTLGSLAPARAFAVTGRAEVEPVLGFIAGASFYVSDMGGNADYYTASGRRQDLRLPLLGYALDARVRRAGFEARAVWAQFFLPNSDALVHAFGENGSPLFPQTEGDVGSLPERIQGGYVELAYDVLHLLRISHELLLFARLETYDTQAKVPAGFKRDPARDVDELTTGLTYRPIVQLAFKADVQLRDRRLGLDEVQWNLGFGYMF